MEKIGKLVDIGFITFLICTKYVISFTTFSVDGLLREHYSITDVKWQTGKATIRNSEVEDIGNGIVGAYYRQSDGDVPLGRYYLSETEESQVDIEIADKVTGILKGTFELHFENLDEIEGFPSKVSILDGRFEVNERN